MQYNILYLAARPHYDVKDEWGSGIESCLERNLLEKSVFLKLVSKFYIENVTVSLKKIFFLGSVTVRFFFLSIPLDCMWTCILSSSSLSKGTLKLNSSLLTHLDSRSPLWGFLYNIRPILVYWGKQKPNQQRGYREGSHPPPKGERGGRWQLSPALSLDRNGRSRTTKPTDR